MWFSWKLNLVFHLSLTKFQITFPKVNAGRYLRWIHKSHWNIPYQLSEIFARNCHIHVRRKKIHKLLRGKLLMENFGCPREYGRIAKEVQQRKIYSWHAVGHIRLKYKFHLIFNNSQKVWKNVSQFTSCFTCHEATSQNSRWFCSEKTFLVRSTLGIVQRLLTFRYFVCSYSESVVECPCKPNASLELYCTLLQWLVAVGETDALQAASYSMMV